MVKTRNDLARSKGAGSRGSDASQLVGSQASTHILGQSAQATLLKRLNEVRYSEVGK